MTTTSPRKRRQVLFTFWLDIEDEKDRRKKVTGFQQLLHAFQNIFDVAGYLGHSDDSLDDLGDVDKQFDLFTPFEEKNDVENGS